MSDDLATKLSAFVESVPPVTVGEVRRRMKGSHEHAVVGLRRYASHKPRVFAVALAAVGTTTVLVLSPWTKSGTGGRLPSALSPGAVRLVVDASAAALNSGTAHMAVSESLNGSVVSVWSVDMAFSGADVAESVTWTDYPPAAAPRTSTNGMALVGDNVYRQLNGQWYVEGKADATHLLAVPDPQSFLSNISPSADLVQVGLETVGGEKLTHLQARRPSAAVDDPLVGVSGGTVTAFDVWVDSRNVVQRMTWTTAGQDKTCTSEDSPVTVPLHCTSFPRSTSVDVTFSNLGAPQTVTAPAGALPGSGPWDEPSN
jgi:hypothetical protein